MNPSLANAHWTMAIGQHGPDQRLRLWAVAGSVCIHGLLLLVVANQQDWSTDRPTPTAIKLTLQTSPPAQPVSSPKTHPEIPSSISETVARHPLASGSRETPETSATHEVPPTATDNSKNTASHRPLDTSLDGIRAAVKAWSNATEPPSNRVMPRSTGTIVNPELAAVVAAAPRRKGLPAGAPIPGTGASFTGGGWQQVVRIDDKCFTVITANPLEPGTTDMWYRQPCDD